MNRGSLLSAHGFSPLSNFGIAVKLFIISFSPGSWHSARHAGRVFRKYALWMGIYSFALVGLAAMSIGCALTLESVTELKTFGAEKLSGALISLGLMREMGPLTVSLAWCVRVSALISEETKYFRADFKSDKEFAQNYILPRYGTTMLMATCMGAYGLLIGFATATLVSPFFGVTSMLDFLDSARDTIKFKDIVVYFIKLIAVNPTIGFFMGITAGLNSYRHNSQPAPEAITMTFLYGYLANLMVTIAAFYRGQNLLG